MLDHTCWWNFTLSFCDLGFRTNGFRWIWGTCIKLKSSWMVIFQQHSRTLLSCLSLYILRQLDYTYYRFSMLRRWKHEICLLCTSTKFAYCLLCLLCYNDQIGYIDLSSMADSKTKENAKSIHCEMITMSCCYLKQIVQFHTYGEILYHKVYTHLASKINASSLRQQQVEQGETTTCHFSFTAEVTEILPLWNSCHHILCKDKKKLLQGAICPLLTVISALQSWCIMCNNYRCQTIVYCVDWILMKLTTALYTSFVAVYVYFNFNCHVAFVYQCTVMIGVWTKKYYEVRCV